MIEEYLTYYTLVVLMSNVFPGSSDILIMYERWGVKKTIFSSLIYLTFFISGILLWKLSSNIFFMLLWLISSLHFWDVEKQFRNINKIAFEDIMYFSLFTLPCLRPDDFFIYMKMINGEMFHALFIKASTLIFIGQIIISINSLNRNKSSKYFYLHLFIYMIIFISVAKFNLLVSFFSIFIFIHSLRHLKLSFIRGTVGRGTYFKVLLPISIVSFLMIYFTGKFLSFDGNQLLFFSIGLGSLAFPHYCLETITRNSIKK